ncbi:MULTISPECIES: heat-inducible transcriptional repressor HrcA [Sphingobium]|jgi:heat-inducible transcriptional repressor|uniref:Heat-inducible transcription repressor HrcA n=2 Tax=Sphingobium fuliginis (strain ATCC 27551) TaxID=336203 RepID=A0A292ZCV5_SPHSA|nr:MULTISPECIES: heat-inducible transcriptional repressor HrcA [Sphingobium]OAP32560.1 heat-inducible transcriptional repressor HrcA [Sphingobium sp. 20006FA]AJR26043.1 heat-inducible transcription repressor [Sphingobium sp. YBL2]KXU29446.1 heat-inducible transcriptional repressor HrcA [Sphingobium sp. AM]KYC33376.1 heat-inducible transcriptional repressor HrcA [Sphingobium sp. 22B]MCB4862124.1 heat-inducible transcriptional repressor HrcA [Sphingobium sp. PNB]
MAVTPITELNERARDVFRLVVESYLGTGLPVGSRTISKMASLSLSPASIRNVMQDLEELGLLAAPHTSAGRMPTETGLRLFVDGMMQAAEPSVEERRAIEAGISEGGPIEEALSAATAALSGLSACAGIVMVPKREPVLRQFGFVPLNERQALAVLVGQDGSIENRVVDLPVGVTPMMLNEAANFMSARFGGMTLAQAREALRREVEGDRNALQGAAGELVARGIALWSQDADDRPVLIVRGQAHLLDDGTAADLERVRQLLEQLEGKQEISRLLESALAGSATKIFIGSENKLFSLSGSSVIAAPYRSGDGRVVGVVGVIGPTRLNYARVIPMVDFTAQTLSRLMR